MEFFVCDPDKLDKFYLHQGHLVGMKTTAKNISFVCNTCEEVELIKISTLAKK